jgi:hypothetical protein
MRTVFAVLAAASSLVLAACSTVSPVNYVEPAEFEGGAIEAMYAAYGAPAHVEALADGEQRAVFVYTQRIVARGSTGGDALWRPTPSSTIHPEHRPAGGATGATARFVSITCQVEARHDANGVVLAVATEPYRCERVRRQVPVSLAAADA